MLRNLLYIFVLSLPLSLSSQSIPIGSWSDHLSYSFANSAAVVGNEVFCGTESGVFSYNIQDNSITRYNTINILSDVSTQKMAMNPSNSTLCIFYKDGNIDLIKDGNTTNIPYLKNTNAILDKNINHITFYNEFAYLSFDFGLVKLNTTKKEITETYNFSAIGNNLTINSSGIYNGHIYVATNEGVYKGNLSSNLLDFNNWSIENGLSQSNYTNILVVNNKIFLIKQDANMTLWTKENNIWQQLNIDLQTLKFAKVIENKLAFVHKAKVEIVDAELNPHYNFAGDFNEVNDIVSVGENHIFLAHINVGLQEFRNNHYIKAIKPNGPAIQKAYDMAAKDQKLWVIKGGMSGYFANVNNYGELSYFDGQTWHNQSPWSNILYRQAFDMVDIIPHPTNNNLTYISSWGGGLLQLENNTPKILYNDTNSSIVSVTADKNYFKIGGGDFDEEGNLWISNAFTTTALSVKKADNTWKNFDLTGYIDFSTSLGDVVISPAGHKWILIPRHNEIVIYDDNKTIDNTSDDQIIKLTSNVNDGNIRGSTGIIVAMDKNGDAWAGSSNGIFVFYNADNIFGNYKTGAQRIIIDGGENNEILLETVSVNDIEVDGANRKWIATDGSGVYLISEDGKKQIHHFTMENSPLFSNVVNSMAIDQESGIIFMGTEKGIIAYRSDATTGKENFSEVKVFPNPIRPDYSGPITISGLMENSQLKITDISGTLISELESNGGQAVWDGNDFSGNRASTGIYLLFNSAMDADNQLQTEVTKILFVK